MSLQSFSFAHPWWFAALVPCVLLLWSIRRESLGDKHPLGRIVDAHLLKHLLVGREQHQRWGLFLLGFAMTVILLALAGPTLEGDRSSIARPDAARVIVVDLSGPTGQPSSETISFDQVKSKLLTLLRAQPGGETALVIYAGEPYLVAPLTTDVETIARFVHDLEARIMPVQGNRPDRALRMSQGILQRSVAADRDLVWFSMHPAKMPSGFDLDKSIRLSLLFSAERPMPEEWITASKTSGGIAEPLRVDDQELGRLFELFEKSGEWRAGAEATTGQKVDVGYWLLPLLIPMALLGFRRGLLSLLLGSFLVTGLLEPLPLQAGEMTWEQQLADYRAWKGLASSSNQALEVRFSDPEWQAVADYRAGRYRKAVGYWGGQHSARAHYNRGNALVMLGQYNAALVAYEQALMLSPNDPDIQHNYELIKGQLTPPGQSQADKKPPSQEESTRQQPNPQEQRPADADRPMPAESEAERIAEQWLRGVPDEPGNLLKQKLMIEHRRRQAGKSEVFW